MKTNDANNGSRTMSQTTRDLAVLIGTMTAVTTALVVLGKLGLVAILLL